MDPPTSQMAPNTIDRIEVLKGPYALRYGTGFGGTINFIPSKLRFTNKRNLYGRVSSAYESNKDVVRSEIKIGLSGKIYDITLFGSWSQGNDYKTGKGQIVPANFQRGSFGTNLGIKIASNQQLQVSALYNLARDCDFPALGMDLRNDDTWLFNAKHNISLKKAHLQSWSTTVFGSFVDHLMDNLLKPLDPRTLNANTSAATFNYGGRTESIWKFSGSTLYVGADLRIEGAKGTRKREFLKGANTGKTLEDNVWQNGLISKTGLFGEYQLKTKNYKFSFSGRAELNTANASNLDVEFARVYEKAQKVQFNPSISAGSSLMLEHNITLGLWLGQAQRSGSLTERYINSLSVGRDPYEMLGNPQLRPEVNNQADMTVQWTTKKAALNIDVFASYLQGLISSVINPTLTPKLPSSPGVRQFVNIDEAFKTGFEIGWGQDLFAGLRYHFAIAYTYAQDMKKDKPLPEIAPLDLRYTLRGSYFHDKFRIQATFRHVLEQGRISSEFGETKTPSFSILDVKLAYQPFKLTKFSVGINNLLNENYYEHLSRSIRGTKSPIFSPGRNIYVSFSINF